MLRTQGLFPQSQGALIILLSLLIVTLRYIPDVGSNILALLVPDALVADFSEPVKALAIKCFHSMPFAAPRPGTAQSYQVMLLEGSVRNPFRV